MPALKRPRMLCAGRLRASGTLASWPPGSASSREAGRGHCRRRLSLRVFRLHLHASRLNDLDILFSLMLLLVAVESLIAGAVAAPAPSPVWRCADSCPDRPRSSIAMFPFGEHL